MREADLLSDDERGRLHFGILPGMHPLSLAGSRLLPPALGSVSAALDALRRGGCPAALPRMQLEALLVVARIGSGVATALLGEAHALELATLRRLVLSQLHADADTDTDAEEAVAEAEAEAEQSGGGGAAWAQQAVPVALRSEALLHVCRDSLAAAAQSLLETLHAAGGLAPASRARSAAVLNAHGQRGMLAAAAAKPNHSPNKPNPSSSFADIAHVLEGGLTQGLEFFAPPRTGPPRSESPSGDGTEHGVQLVAGAFGPFSRVVIDFFGGGRNASGAGTPLGYRNADKGSRSSFGEGEGGEGGEGGEDDADGAGGVPARPGLYRAPSDRLGRIRHMSVSDLSALGEEPRILRGGGRGGRQQAELASANLLRGVPLWSPSGSGRASVGEDGVGLPRPLPRPGTSERAAPERPAERPCGHTGSEGEDGAGLLPGLETEAAAMVLSCLPGLREALARLVSALSAACRERAADPTAGEGARVALRGAAAGLEQSMGREHGFWRCDEYAVRSVLRLVAEEAQLELLLTRLQQLLTATPRQSHVRRPPRLPRAPTLATRAMHASAAQA